MGDERNMVEIEMENTTNTKLDVRGHVNLGFVSHPDGELEPSPYTTVGIKDGSVRDGKGEKVRDVWDKPVEFLLSIVAMSVGLGNIWRFPYVAFTNGGGAFLIPYLIVLVLIGRPIYYLEMCFGQFSRYGQIKAWNISPLFKGIGYGSLVASICIASYYCSIMAQVAFYLFASFAETLPWKDCNPEWGANKDGDQYCFENGTVNQVHGESAAALYYKLKVFPVKNSIDDGLGSPDWKLSLCLLLAWSLIFLSLVKGVKSSGKVAYFTAIFPYAVLIILLVRGVTLPGAWEGIRYFIEPRWSEMLKAKVWYRAVGQMFFSLTTGFGPIIMFSSFNKFNHNVYRDAIIISFMDTFTSMLAGCTIFAVLGYLANDLGVNISDVATAGPGLVFVAYPTAIAKFPVGQVFAILFFLMLLTLGIGSATSLGAAVTTVISDKFPSSRKWLVTLVVCVLGYFSGLMYLTPGGNLMIDLVDHFGASFVIYVMALLEVVAICWGYGLNSFCKDIEFMLGIKVGRYYKFTWGIFIPLSLFGIFVYTMATQESLQGFPTSAIVCGWTLVALILLLIPGMAIHSMVRAKGNSIAEKFSAALRPTILWGPQEPKLRAEWLQFKNK